MGNLIENYGKMRKLKSQNVLAPNNNLHQANENIVRVMSYNILADGDGYALAKSMDYGKRSKDNDDPLAFRKWSYRGPRILAQILLYKPDIICLQETTNKTFFEYLEPELAKAGYCGVHGMRDLTAVKHGDLSRMTDAMFYNKHKFNLMDLQIIGINKAAKEKRSEYQIHFGVNSYAESYPFLEKLVNQCDIFIVLYLQLIKSKKP